MCRPDDDRAGDQRVRLVPRMRRWPIRGRRGPVDRGVLRAPPVRLAALCAGRLTSVIELEDVRAAARRLEGVVHRTPVLTSATLDAAVGATTYLKAEHLQ